MKFDSRHAGARYLSDDPDAPTDFDVRVIVCRALSPRGEDHYRSAQRVAPGDVAHPSKTRVLLAHQDALLAAGIAATLNGHNEFDVTRADGVESTSLAWRSVDVAIADYHTAVDQMRSGEAHRRVLIVSGHAGEARVLLALELGARGYLLSDCSCAELLHSIRTISRGGTALSPQVAENIAESVRSPPLTERELEVLGELMKGLGDKDIANKLSISVETSKSHMKRILAKLNASGRAEAIAIAQRRGILLAPTRKSHAAQGSLGGSREAYHFVSPNGG
jgi:DNA-binding NarL/FixJ family response regulator